MTLFLIYPDCWQLGGWCSQWRHSSGPAGQALGSGPRNSACSRNIYIVTWMTWHVAGVIRLNTRRDPNNECHARILHSLSHFLCSVRITLSCRFSIPGPLSALSDPAPRLGGWILSDASVKHYLQLFLLLSVLINHGVWEKRFISMVEED